jgi:hypothetical protein
MNIIVFLRVLPVYPCPDFTHELVLRHSQFALPPFHIRRSAFSEFGVGVGVEVGIGGNPNRLSRGLRRILRLATVGNLFLEQKFTEFFCFTNDSNCQLSLTL